MQTVRSFDSGWQESTYQPDDPTKQYVSVEEGEAIELDVNAELASSLHAYATVNTQFLGLDDRRRFRCAASIGFKSRA